MLLKRHLRRRYHPASERQRPVLRPAVGTALLLLAVFFLGEWTLRFFGVGNPLRAAAVTLTTEGRGIVNVSLEGEAAQRAENDIKLYPGDRVMTLGGGYAALRLFDGSDLRLNEATDIAIVESVHGEERSEIVLELIEGSLWIATPARSSFSGAILRRIRSPRLSFDIPSHTEALIAPNSLSVFSSDGIGIEVSIGGVPEHIVIGEGQTFLLPPGIDLKEDLYEHRSPLDPRQLASPFLEESRRIHAGAPPHPSRGSPAAEPGELLSVATPADGAAVQTTAIDVNGRMGAGVARIRVNGYQALLDRENGTFFLELNLPDEDEVSIAIEAVDEQGNVIGEIRRTVRRDREAPSPPSITAPAGSGSTYRTAAARVELHAVAVNHHRIGVARREPAELGVDQPEPPHHGLGRLVRPVAQLDVLLDGVDARRQHDDPLRIPPVADRQHLAQRRVIGCRILGHVRLERDARALEEDDAIGAIVLGGIAVIGVVDAREVLGDADGVSARGDVFEHARGPHAFFAFAVRTVVIEVAELPDQRALADARPADNGHPHQMSTLTTLVTSSTLVSPSVSSHAE